ncbi:type I DNA topoisomerase [Catenisphaera adipataccumulans]|jgi:DNA topoisomerase-1|uniref:DNA topoisomerase 1 n=1 Tax=Catenisphaera adipataccumulans TaxID=700500 RepID=A0A7W8CYI9_9FIRM|nr:type I DNA topoisomerase [Catenisphaera adipataccumulans]MBB5183921.1 DNA topoisomerase-1 [Catenisphaera adipataccumulans]
MKKHLVIVESPSKAKTIEKYLGSDYKVVSSKGHICDLSTSGKERLGIDIENNFEPKYSISRDKRETVKELKELTKKAKDVYLASDPDREGEAIAWHLARVLGLNTDENNRIVFHEITKPTVLAALDEPRKIDMNLVKSQETRRMLDRIIGFKLSKLLQNKIRSKSAGRVQSVALRLIVDRENEIKAFKPEEYWTVHAQAAKNRRKFEATLSKVDGKKPKISNKEQADAIVDRCQGDFEVTAVTKRKKTKQPKLPFTTSTLQQEASIKLGFGARRTMSVAQRLYEGIDLGGRQEGLISYMRTDSTRLSDLFVNDAMDYIDKTYGKEYHGKVHQKNSANAQDAHEAIRPTNINYTPESIRQYLKPEEYRLYSLIYARTLASLMKEAVFDATSVTMEHDGCQFKATGQTMTFDGYTKVYGKYEKSKDELLPELKKGDILKDVHVEGKQHFTEPPARYTEARLIKELEEKSIGRPSTYATIIDTLQKRGYATLEKASETSKTKVFVPTQQGILTDEKLRQYFSSVINVEYTAEMEKTLDEIAEGKKDNVAYLRSFYDNFQPLVDQAYEKMPKKELEKVGKKCPKCGGELVYRNGKYGKFISCINFPKCKYTENIDEPEEAKEEKFCPKCGAPMVIKRGKYGMFWACSNYPECKTIVPLKEKPKAEPTGEMCPVCGHELVRRRSRYGKMFIGCSNYPKCHYIKKEPKKEKKKDEA